MWIPKCVRDENKGVDSPIPTQAVSNEEFIPRPQTEDQRKWEIVIAEMAEEKSKKLGMGRRDFMRSSMGMATAFLAARHLRHRRQRSSHYTRINWRFCRRSSPGN